MIKRTLLALAIIFGLSTPTHMVASSACEKVATRAAKLTALVLISMGIASYSEYAGKHCANKADKALMQARYAAAQEQYYSSLFYHTEAAAWGSIAMLYKVCEFAWPMVASMEIGRALSPSFKQLVL